MGQAVLLGHIRHQRPGAGDARTAPNEVVPIWHIRRQKLDGAKMSPNQPGNANMTHKMSKARWCQDGTCHYNTYNVND